MSADTNKKHAYLIMAHNNFEQLQILIDLLDDERNDIYLHIDKKANKLLIEPIKTKYSELFWVEPISVMWGGHSQIECEMLLFRCSAPKHYMYYHILSGQDLPLKKQDEIHTFFQENFGRNFISYDKNAEETRNFLFRTQYYHFFRNFVGKSKKPIKRFFLKLDKKSVELQTLLQIRRKEIIPLHKGANWVSITDEMVQYVLSCEKIIKKQFYYSYCADEVFLQSIAMQSPYCDTIVRNNYRAIDWQRGCPYTYRKEDVPKLLGSPDLFARKFDSAVDDEAISLIVDYIVNNQVDK